MSSSNEHIFEKVVKSFGTPVQHLCIIEQDDDMDDFLRDFNDYLISTKMMDDNSNDLPYHVIRMGSDEDMLDDMYRFVASGRAEEFGPSSNDVGSLYSKQQIFQHLYNSITKEKFIVFQILEEPLLNFFKIGTYHYSTLTEYSNPSERERAQINQLPVYLQLPHFIDDCIIHYLNDLRGRGPEEHRNSYRSFFRIVSGLIMELSNVFLVVPTAGMNRHLVVSSWRTQTLLLGFSPLTWSSGSFDVFDLSGRDIDTRWAYPNLPNIDSRRK